MLLSVSSRPDSSYRDMMKRQLADSGAFKVFLKTHAHERVKNILSVKLFFVLVFPVIEYYENTGRQFFVFGKNSDSKHTF